MSYGGISYDAASGFVKFSHSKGDVHGSLLHGFNYSTFTDINIGSSSLYLFNVNIYLLIMSVTIFFLIGLNTYFKISPSEGLWSLIKLFLGKSPLNIESKIFSLFVIFFFYSFVIIHNEFMRTDHIAAKPPHIINNLNELYKSNILRPLFFDGTDMFKKFKNSKCGIKSKIWTKVKKIGVKKSIINFEEFTKDFKTGKLSKYLEVGCIDLNHIIDFHKIFFCKYLYMQPSNVAGNFLLVSTCR